MKNLKFAVLLALMFTYQALNAQTKLVQITTIESTVAGGIGRSLMIITDENGGQQEVELNNLFSTFGINFKNIKLNEHIISSTLKGYLDKGFQLLSTTPLTLSAASGGNSTGIFMTRYTLTKNE